MKEVILTTDIQLRKELVEAGSEGTLIITQDEFGGHLVSIDPNDIGFVDIATSPGATTYVKWSVTETKILWQSTKLSSDVVIPNPSQITSLLIEIVDTVSAKIKWNAPQGFTGSDSTKVDLYYLILSTSPIDPGTTYDAARLIKLPLSPNSPEVYIIPNLNSGQRYYAALYSEKAAFGQTRRSAISNVVTFFTTALDGNASVPKRIPINADKILETFLHINFVDGEYLTNYPSFERLAEQDYLIDNNGVPEGTPPRSIVSAYQSYGTLQPSWYNIGSYKVFFELDGTYDLDYLYLLVQNQNRFTIYTSGDGVTLFKAFDKLDTPTNMSGWTKIPLNDGTKTNIKFIVLALYVGDEWINGFVPYGTRKNIYEIQGEKFKKTTPVRTIDEAYGTNAFLAETQYDWIGKVSDVARLYNESDWNFPNTSVYPSKNWGPGTHQDATPDDIELVSATSHMWDYDVVMQEMLDEGQKELLFTWVAWPLYLRVPATGVDPRTCKPVDPGLDFHDLAITTNPQSYKHIARIAASQAYRYGTNAAAPEVCNQYIDPVPKKALGLVKYFEYGNETDRYWQGENALFNPQEYAAMASALYDGHKGALGAGFGIKSADPNAKLVMAGLLSINHSYIKEMMLWCDLYRGPGDYPWDVINFHHYNAYLGSTDTPVYSSVPAWGMAPELGYLIPDTKKVLRLRGLEAQNKEVWVSEWGYDEQNGGMHSPKDATPALRGRHKAVWILRTIMIYKALGIDVGTHYWYAGDSVRVEDLNPNEVTRELFYTSGLVDGVTWAADRNRKPLISWWYVVSFRNALLDYNFTHAIMEAGERKIVEDDIVINYHPNLWMYAFEHKTSGAKLIVAWLGLETWATFNVDLRLNNDVIGVPVTDFIQQDIRQSEQGVVSNVVPLVSESGKHALFSLTETPLVIKSELVGTARLIPPVNLRVQSITANSIKLAWTDENIGTAKARVYMSLFPDHDFNIIEEVYRDDAETTITGLLSSTPYWFRVQFIDGAKESITSGTVSTSTLFLLSPPEDLEQTGATASTIELAWSFPEEEESTIQSFVIYRSNLSNGVYDEVGRVAPTERTFRDIGLVASTQYYYKVRTAKDGVVSNFTFVAAGSTTAPSLEPPTIQSGSVHTSGSYIELIFNEELKDEQSAITAFTIMETLNSGDLVAHPVSAISIGIDKTKVRLNFDITVFKTSSVNVSYSAALGALKSIYNVAVNTFSSFNIVNNTFDNFVALVGWTEITAITLNRNNLTASGAGGRAVSQSKIAAGSTIVLQFNCQAEDSMILGLDVNQDPEGFTTMDYYVSKRNGVVEYKKPGTISSTAVTFGVGIIRWRTDGSTIYLEVSYDNGLTFTLITTSPQANVDLYPKVYTNGSPEKLLNIVNKGLVGAGDDIIPDAPTDLVIDDDDDTAEITLNPAYALTEHEFSTNYDALTPIWSQMTTNPLLLGDVNIPAGGFAARVRGATGRLPSAAVISTEPFTGSINTDSKIMVQKSSGGTVLYSTNILSELFTWLASAVITEPITVQFNTSDVYPVPGTAAPTYNNGVHRVTFKGAAGVLPVFDGQRVPSSVWRCEENYTTLQNMAFINADIENVAGAIIRADERNNMQFLNLVFDYGYCGMRATTGCYNLEFDGLIVRNTKEGSLRLGNGVVIDQSNISIKNIKFDDVTNGGLIEGTIYPYFGGFALKVTAGYTIENVGALSGDRLYYLGVIENSSNLVFKNIRGTYLQSLSNTGIQFINCYLPQSSYLSETVNIELLHSHLDLNISNCGNFSKIRGNVFPRGIVGTLRTGADIPDIENNNVIVALNTEKYINFGFLNGDPEFFVDETNLATYKLTQGGNSLYIPYTNRAMLNLNPFGSLRGNSAGKSLITAVIEGITVDTYGTPRTYPTDPGPFGGSRPDVNDKPVPPEASGDNLERTLVFTHPLGASEILVSVNDGLYVPYSTLVVGGSIPVGDLALSGGYYKAKTKSAPYRDESDIAYSPSFTDKPDTGDYEVLRTFEVNFRSEFCSPAADPARTVNEYWGTTAEIASTTLEIDLVEDDGTASDITLGNGSQGFDGAGCAYIPDAPALTYIRDTNAIRSGWNSNQGTPAKLVLKGLELDRFYQFYFISGTSDENSAVKISINGFDVTKVTTANYPLTANGDIYSNPAVIKIPNIQADGSGEITIDFLKQGPIYQQVMVNYMMIEESNEEKPI